jgi:hypothetical protein
MESLPLGGTTLLPTVAYWRKLLVPLSPFTGFVLFAPQRRLAVFGLPDPTDNGGR